MIKAKRSPFMSIFLKILIAFCAFCIIYIVIAIAVSVRAGKELEKQGCEAIGDEISIYADAENVEYCIRAAIAESTFKVKRININIPSGSPEREKTAAIAERFRRKHKNIKINYI